MKQLSMEELNKITETTIGAAIEVHRNLGPGLLESAYRECLRYELLQRGYEALQEVPLPLKYKGTELDCGYRLDLLVNDAVIVEIKSVDNLAPIHDAQILSYLKISGGRLAAQLQRENTQTWRHKKVRQLTSLKISVNSVCSVVNFHL